MKERKVILTTKKLSRHLFMVTWIISELPLKIHEKRVNSDISVTDTPHLKYSKIPLSRVRYNFKCLGHSQFTAAFPVSYT